MNFNKFFDFTLTALRSIFGSLPFVFFIYTPLLFIFSIINPRKKNLWLFSAWEGKYYRGNSKYLFEYLKDNEKINAVWITKNYILYKKMKSDGYKVVYAYSWFGLISLLNCKVIFISHGFNDILPIFTKRATIICLGHTSYPIKDMSYDNEFYKLNLFKKLMIFFIYPFNLSKPNYEIVISEKTYKSTIFLDPKKIYEKKRILPLGQPKTDYILRERGNDKTAILNKLGDLFPSKFKKCNIILFLPTWRKKKNFSLFDYNFNLKKINEILIKTNSYLLINYHPFDKKNLHTDYTKYRIINTSINGDKINQLLLSADIFITDYSSLYSEFLLLNKPMIFAKFNHQEYVKERNLNIKYNTLPGEIATDWEKILLSIEKILIDKIDSYLDLRKEWLDNIYLGHDDGNSSKRITNFVKKLTFN